MRITIINKDNDRCTRCNSFDHTRRDCQETCHYCGEKGHYQRRCMMKEEHMRNLDLQNEYVKKYIPQKLIWKEANINIQESGSVDELYKENYYQ